MPTKLSRYAEGLMEAAWLAALIVVPVFFNVYSARIFEPDKITLLRTLALLILAAWVVKLVDEGGIRWVRLSPGKPLFRTLWRMPLLAPVIGLAVVYIISTIFSVTPATSLWGSYQRLQGTYTTFSYLVIFAAIAGNLRQKAQVERLITAVIVSSLPVSLYGVMQHYKIDPVPWGGDVSTRIAANMGNSIFVAAYLIMVFPLVAIRIVDAFTAILNERGKFLPNFVRATAYVFIIALQVIALYFTGSRGPWLGWLASSFLLLLVLSLLWRKRWLTISIVAVALALMAFLVVLNIPNGPLESLRARPEFNRLGQVFDAESRTGRVRALIWSGTAKLVAPHPPLQFPDGRQDSLNFLRPLIGYGPESMYVAYNPFYPPALTQVEKRNASPDRSHNETWDSLVITGVLGLAVYLVLYLSVFYFGLKWLGLINSPRQRRMFLGLTIGGGVIGALGFVLFSGVAYLGVGLPFGIIIGLFAYIILVTLFGHYQSPQTEGEKLRTLTLAGLLVVIVAHFVEVNFGISIAATLTYFWAFSALILVIGYVLPLYGEYGMPTVQEGVVAASGDVPAEPTAQAPTRRDKKAAVAQKKKRRTGRESYGQVTRSGPSWLREAIISVFIVTILLVTLGYDFISNAQGSQSASEIIWSSLISLKSASSGVSFGMLAMFLVTWVVTSLVLTSESFLFAESRVWTKVLFAVLGVSMLFGLIFWLWHAGGLAYLASNQASTLEGVLQQVAHYEGIVTKYYIYLFLIVFGMAAFLPIQWPVKSPSYTWLGAGAGAIGLLVVVALTAYTNLRIIQADIAFKLAEPFTRADSWPVAIRIYNRANDLAPTEDYYYLFLGRAYLEQAKTLTQATERDQLISLAERDLRRAQTINPLNTDHTANLARLYSLWASVSTDPTQRAQRAQISSDYFSKAVTLSPNNARIWDEWALLFLNIIKNPDEAYQRLQHSKEIDALYDWTYGLLGDYYTQMAASLPDSQPAEKQQAISLALDNYTQATKLVDPTDQNMRYNYAIALANAQTQMGQVDAAIGSYQQAATIARGSTDGWKIEEAIARLYAQKGDTANALIHYQNALAAAPDDQKDRLRALVAQVQSQ